MIDYGYIGALRRLAEHDSQSRETYAAEMAEEARGHWQRIRDAAAIMAEAMDALEAMNLPAVLRAKLGGVPGFLDMDDINNVADAALIDLDRTEAAIRERLESE